MEALLRDLHHGVIDDVGDGGLRVGTQRGERGGVVLDAVDLVRGGAGSGVRGVVAETGVHFAVELGKDHALAFVQAVVVQLLEPVGKLGADAHRVRQLDELAGLLREGDVGLVGVLGELGDVVGAVLLGRLDPRELVGRARTDAEGLQEHVGRGTGSVDGRVDGQAEEVVRVDGVGARADVVHGLELQRDLEGLGLLVEHLLQVRLLLLQLDAEVLGEGLD